MATLSLCGVDEQPHITEPHERRSFPIQCRFLSIDKSISFWRIGKISLFGFRRGLF